MKKDDATTPRAGEELNEKALKDFLRARLPTPFTEMEVLQFPAGSSNLTYLVRLGSTQYVLRRPPFGNTVRTAHDMKREFEVLSKLAFVYPPAPEPILFCDDESVIGAEFYLMEKRDGVVIRGQVPALFAASKEVQTKLCRSFMDNLARLHSVNYTAAGLADLGKPEGYNRRQVEGWTQRYIAAKTEEHTELEAAMKWLGENVPVEAGASLIHNDYKFDNIMLDPEDLTRIIAVLDWEMVTIGDPLMDLGTTLGYWMSPKFGEELMNMPFNPRILMENISRRELVELYASARGIAQPDMLFYYVFGTFKIAVIAQQIYARFVKGMTKDERFANFDRFVAALGRISNSALERGSI
ncbi:MAG: phosphotransferase family protein [Acidobacteriota bacterium]|nr:MAG: phosphotransferase family protein [Acidobacteriota bacterium]